MKSHPVTLDPDVRARDLAARVELGLLLGRCHDQEGNPARELGALAALAEAIRTGASWRGEILGCVVAVHCPRPWSATDKEEIEITDKGRELLAAARGAA